MRKLIKVLKFIGISLLSIVVLIFLFIGVYSQIGNSKIEAEIEGLGTKILAVQLKTVGKNEKKYKIGFCINDKLTIRVSADKLKYGTIRVVEKRKWCQSKSIDLYVEPNSKTIITGKANELSIDYKIIEGSDLNKQVAELNSILLPLKVEESKLWYKKRKEKDISRKKELYYEMTNLKNSKINPVVISFAKRYPNYSLSARILHEYKIPCDTTIKYYNRLTEDVKNSYHGKLLQNHINSFQGNIAPVFSSMSLSGKNVRLKDFSDKLVVLDFWGTWCGPCMYGVPKMKEYYNKYKTQVEFIGIGCNDKESAWKKAIEENQMNWIQILNADSSTNIKELYGIRTYPTKIIINKKGEIINKFEGEVDAFYHAIDSLVKKQTTARVGCRQAISLAENLSHHRTYGFIHK